MAAKSRCKFKCPGQKSVDSIALCGRHGHVEVSRLLLQHKADICAHDDEDWTPLYTAANFGHVYVARLLLEHGADVNAPDNHRNTPLLIAVKERHLEVARLLVEHGADIDAEDDDGRTAFQVASERGHHDIAKLLSDHAPNNITIVDSWTPLHWAACFGHIEGSRLLLEYNADICATMTEAGLHYIWPRCGTTLI
ncbi:ankyrin repeat-containing domain protein [Russula aff. rugulosa BPL654]|nr:ankyrin repeat-containing domain protein [Russula aff. rugulosa BPL654]